MDCQWNPTLAKKGIMQCDVCGWKYPKKYEKNPKQLHRNCSKAKQLPPRTDEEIRIIEKICDDCPHHAALEDRCQSPLCCSHCGSQKGLQLAKVRPNAAWTCKEGKWPAYERCESGLILPEKKPILAGSDLAIPKPFGGMLPMAVREMSRRRCCKTTGACCIDGECSITTEAECTASNGEWQGAGTECDPNPCEGVTVCDEIVSCGDSVTLDLGTGGWTDSNCDKCNEVVGEYVCQRTGDCTFGYTSPELCGSFNNYRLSITVTIAVYGTQWRWIAVIGFVAGGVYDKNATFASSLITSSACISSTLDKYSEAAGFQCGGTFVSSISLSV